MSAPSAEWHEVALAKLTRVLGAERGAHEMRATLHEIGLTTLSSAEDLHAFAQAFVARGGFAGAVGGLLSVHAVMHGARTDDRRPHGE